MGRKRASPQPVRVFGNAICCEKVGEAIATLEQDPAAGTNLTLQNDHFGDDLAHYPKSSLGDALANNTHVEQVTLNSLTVTRELADELILGLNNNPRVTKLSFFKVTFGPRVSTSLATVVKSMPNLKHLVILPSSISRNSCC